MRATAVEGLRQPATLLVTLSFYVATVLTPLFQAFQFGEPGRMVRDGGLAFMLLAGLVLAVCTAAATIRREIVGGIASVALSRPLSRGLFLCAKFAGVAGVLTAFSGFALFTILLSERVAERFVFEAAAMGHFMDVRLATGLLLLPPAALAVAGLAHYRRRGHFAAMAFGALQAGLLLLFVFSGFFAPTGIWQRAFTTHLNWAVSGAALLVLLALVLLAALATALATRLDVTGVFSACAAVAGIGLVADPLFGRPTPGSVPGLLVALVPNFQHFWLCDALAGGGFIPPVYLWRATLYAALWIALALLAGTWALRTREIC